MRVSRDLTAIQKYAYLGHSIYGPQAQLLKRKTQKRTYLYNLYTLWLFTASDLKTVVYPTTIFGISGAISGHLTTNQSTDIVSVLVGIPLVVFYVWINLLVEVVANQRLPASITEDSINKPWRSLPSQRVSPDEARLLLLCLVPLVISLAFFHGCERESLLLIAFSWMYNDLGGADTDPVVRNLLNAGGLLCFGAGATIVASGGYSLNLTAHVWFALLGAVIFFTVHTQDMADMEGDAARGRKTLPLVYGEKFARRSAASAIVGFSVACAAFWQLGFYGYVLVMLLGSLLALRLLLFKSVAADQTTWKVWCVWIALLYMLPLSKIDSTPWVPNSKRSD